MTKDECVKRNLVQLSKSTLNHAVEVYIMSHDESTAKIFSRAKKQFDDMMEGCD